MRKNSVDVVRIFYSNEIRDYSFLHLDKVEDFGGKNLYVYSHGEKIEVLKKWFFEEDKEDYRGFMVLRGRNPQKPWEEA